MLLKRDKQNSVLTHSRCGSMLANTDVESNKYSTIDAMSDHNK